MKAPKRSVTRIDILMRIAADIMGQTFDGMDPQQLGDMKQVSSGAIEGLMLGLEEITPLRTRAAERILILTYIIALLIFELDKVVRIGKETVN